MSIITDETKFYKLYTRHSFSDAKGATSSYDRQIYDIQSYLNPQKGWICDGIIKENVSGFKEDADGKRLELEKFYQDVKSGRSQATYLIVQSWDRFSRNLSLAFRWIERFKAIGVEINAVRQWVQMDGPTAYLMLGLYIGQAQDASRFKSMTISGGMWSWAEKGYKVFGKAYGYQKDNVLDENGKTNWQLIPEKKEGLFKFFDYIYSDNLTRAASRMKVKEVYGFSITHSSAYRMIPNLFYSKFVKGREGNWIPGRHEQLLDLNMQMAVIDKTRKEDIEQEIKKAKIYRSKDISHKYAARGSVCCPKCGKFMVKCPSTSKTKKTIHYLACRKCKVYQNSNKVNNLLLNVLKEFEINESTYDKIIKETNKKTLQKTQELRARSNRLKNKLKASTSRRSKVNILFVDDQITRKEFNVFIKQIEIDIKKTQFELSSIEETLKNVDNRVLSIAKTMMSLSDFFSLADEQKQQQILLALFPLGFDVNELKTGGFVRTPYLNSI
ncbi:MAG: recombinase family protein, partial [Saprospiraceae bacterium]